MMKRMLGFGAGLSGLILLAGWGLQGGEPLPASATTAAGLMRPHIAGVIRAARPAETQPAGDAFTRPLHRGPTATPSPSPLDRIRQITFADSRHGWAGGLNDCYVGLCPYALDATTDGGRTWQTRPDPSVLSNGQSGDSVYTMRFSSAQDGWLLADVPWVTHDSGFTWKPTLPGGRIALLETHQGNAWALQEHCGAEQLCHYTLLVSADGGYTWQRRSTPPALGWEPQQLVRLDAQHAWILAAQADHHFALIHTSDAGYTWQILPTPPGAAGWFAALSALPGGTLWLMTGIGGEGRHNQTKILYTSTDGGRRWHTQAAGLWPEYPDVSPNERTALSLPDNPAALSLTLPYDDQLAGFGLLAPGRAWYTVGFGSPRFTKDGGRTWPNFFQWLKGNGQVFGGPIVVLQPRYGWMAASSVVYYTTDGGTVWNSTQVPGHP
ncbi:MAG: hypothetical protein M3Z04_08690 [Chloroflexota bacterium]|nr:hypothetical protein [Chloroflexota bacterium]